MKLQPNKKYTAIAIYAFLVIAAAIALFYLINEHATVGRVIGTFVSLMIPFIYGAALAYILNPVLNWLEKKVFPRLFGERLSRRARRRIGVLISFIFAAAVVAIFLAILIPQIVESINSLAQSIYAFLPQAQQTLNEWTAKYGSNELLLNVLEILGIDVSDPSLALQRLATRSYTFLTQVLPNLFGGVMRFTSGLLNVVVGIIIAVYLLLSKEVFYAQVKKLMFAFFPRRAAQAVLNLTHDSNAIFCGFISGKIVDSAIIGVLCFIGCSSSADALHGAGQLHRRCHQRHPLFWSLHRRHSQHLHYHDRRPDQVADLCGVYSGLGCSWTETSSARKSWAILLACPPSGCCLRSPSLAGCSVL